MPNIVAMECLVRVEHQIAAARHIATCRQVDLAQIACVGRATVDVLENGRASGIGFTRLMRMLTFIGFAKRIGRLTEQLAEPMVRGAEPDMGTQQKLEARGYGI